MHHYFKFRLLTLCNKIVKDWIRLLINLIIRNIFCRDLTSKLVNFSCLWTYKMFAEVLKLDYLTQIYYSFKLYINWKKEWKPFILLIPMSVKRKVPLILWHNTYFKLMFLVSIWLKIQRDSYISGESKFIVVCCPEGKTSRSWGIWRTWIVQVPEFLFLTHWYSSREWKGMCLA